MKKAACIIPYTYLPATNGGQKLIAGFTHHLGKAIELHCIGTPDNDTAPANTYSFHPLLHTSRWRYADVFSFFRIKKIIVSGNIDTIILEHPYLGWLGWWLKKKFRVQLIVHTHNIEYQRFRSIGKIWWPLLKWYEGWALRKADKVFCISDEDRIGMIQYLNVKPEQCIIIPYGIEQQGVPANKDDAKAKVCKELNIDGNTKLLFFNGTLNYKPNLDALDSILNEINPLLLNTGLNYKILIAGKNLPDSYNHLQHFQHQNVIFLGFVNDIDRYTLSADVLLNPVNSGGGVKTKMIEALALNTTVISTEAGAVGVNKTVCGEKLVISKNTDWKQFTEKVTTSLAAGSISTPPEFYKQYNWSFIIKSIIS